MVRRIAIASLVCLGLTGGLLLRSRAAHPVPAAVSPHTAEPGEPLYPLPEPTAKGDAVGEKRFDDAKQRGVALGLFAEDVSFSYAPMISEIVALGATHVSLVVPVYQIHGGSTSLRLHTRFSPTLEATADVIRLARRAGLEVTLFPIVRLSNPRNPSEWRGTLAPASRDAWFASYGRFLSDLASLGAATGVSRLAVGSELSTLDGDLPRWQKLLERIRALFSGTLLYSANWDHYQDARVFELVDEIGVTAYFSLREKNGPSDVASLTKGWQRVRGEIEFNLAPYAKPFIFTEIGYRSRVGATAEPWDEGSGGQPDVDEQVRGFEAFRQAWTGKGAGASRLAGLYVWNWYGYGGPNTNSYTPRGKPAVDVIRQILDEM